MFPNCCRSEAWIAAVWRVLLDTHIVRAAEIQASDRQQSGNIIPRAVIHSLALLKMDKELPETCWTNLKINKLLLLHLVGPLLYLVHDAR